ncbi:phosphotransferase family protein [Ligilactobacillus ceti]|uniref:Phosphotransferase family protein n=1 Tax=Ligilactobacillus ceti DSM 22408 TaxID=1122146 RepID=A0A0R2KGI6_9LACO|nr:phosphotransferase family protein [Ligilactobacillus ceti]KRN88515.1 phosphotransferase family protein [Ligilactobacillus ceti DSM 22408]
MDFKLDEGWRVLPIGGETGMAYMGINKNEKVFLKRNTSPFLAALSLEEITPKLIWTKRMTSGDTLTAQEWMNGRSLKRSEMTSQKVRNTLYRVHHSELLKKMLKKVGGQFVTPNDLLTEYLTDLSCDLQAHPVLAAVVSDLQAQQPQLPLTEYEVCHGDLNHKNWLLSDQGQLYLVDWDSAKLADPALDLSMLMCQYVPRKTWKQWLEEYGQEATASFNARINWYMLMNLLLAIKKYHSRGRFHEMNQDIYKLAEIYELD